MLDGSPSVAESYSDITVRSHRVLAIRSCQPECQAVHESRHWHSMTECQGPGRRQAKLPVSPRTGRLGWGRVSTPSRVESDSGYATFVKESKDLIQKVLHHRHPDFVDHYMHEWGRP